MPTAVHAKYQIYNLGYQIRKYLFGSKAPQRKLYNFDDDSSSEVDREKPKRQWDDTTPA